MPRQKPTNSIPNAAPSRGNTQRPRRHVVENKGRPIYQWEQTPTDVTVFIPAPPFKSKAFCNISANFIQLGALTPGLPCSWFLNHYTGGAVNQAKSYWKNGPETCKIVMNKARPGLSWRYALRDERDETTQHARPTVLPLAPRPATPRKQTQQDALPMSPESRRKMDSSPISPLRRATVRYIKGDASPISPKREPTLRNVTYEERMKQTGRKKSRSILPKATRVKDTPVKATPAKDNTSSDNLGQKNEQKQLKNTPRRNSSPNQSTKVVYMQKLLKEKDMKMTQQSNHVDKLKKRIQQLEQEKEEEARVASMSTRRSIQQLQEALNESKGETQQDIDALQASKREAQAKLDHQTELATSLQDRITKQEATLKEQQILIGSQAASIETKEKLIASMERRLQEQLQQHLNDYDDSSDELKQTKQAWNESQLQIQQLQGEHKLARKQIRELETELDEQLADWRLLEKDVEDAQARVRTLEAELAVKEEPEVPDIPFKENSVNEYLDRLSRKMIQARSQLEEVSRRRKKLRSRVTPVDAMGVVKS